MGGPGAPLPPWFLRLCCENMPLLHYYYKVYNCSSPFWRLYSSYSPLSLLSQSLLPPFPPYLPFLLPPSLASLPLISSLISILPRLLRLAVIFSSPKVKLHIQHRAEFMQHCPGHFDVIITGSSDLIDEDIEALQVIAT